MQTQVKRTDLIALAAMYADDCLSASGGWDWESLGFNIFSSFPELGEEECELGDEFLSTAISELRKMRGILREDAARLASHLVLEREVEVCSGSLTLDATLRAYGRLIKADPGQRGEPGERRVSPPEPAYVEIDRVTISFGEREVDVTDSLTQADTDRIATAAYEAMGE